MFRLKLCLLVSRFDLRFNLFVVMNALENTSDSGRISFLRIVLVFAVGLIVIALLSWISSDEVGWYRFSSLYLCSFLSFFSLVLGVSVGMVLVRRIFLSGILVGFFLFLSMMVFSAVFDRVTEVRAISYFVSVLAIPTYCIFYFFGLFLSNLYWKLARKSKIIVLSIFSLLVVLIVVVLSLKILVSFGIELPYRLSGINDHRFGEIINVTYFSKNYTPVVYVFEGVAPVVHVVETGYSTGGEVNYFYVGDLSPFGIRTPEKVKFHLLPESKLDFVSSMDKPVPRNRDYYLILQPGINTLYAELNGVKSNEVQIFME